jgi:hypothetical protein
MARPDVQYNPVPDAPEVRGSGGQPLQVQATPEKMGAAVGAGLEDLGKQGQDLSLQYQNMATEARVNDDYANKYMPAAAALHANYDKLDYKDKLQGYDTYIGGLQSLNRQFVSTQPNPYGQQIMGNLIDRHISGEVDSAKREAVQAQIQYEAQSGVQAIKANIDSTGNFYNDPERVASVDTMNRGLVAKSHIDTGTDPTTPEGQATIRSAQDATTGAMAVTMTSSAIAKNDLPAANAIRAQYAPVIPGYQQLYIDGVLHAANTQQNGSVGVKALAEGKPVPEFVGQAPSSIRAIVADTAKVAGLNENEALTVLQIESSGGTNTGTRGTIGQDKASAGKSIGEQAQALCDNYKDARLQAGTALGRDAQPWEAYTVYQQGAGGGVALLKADPSANAIATLTPLYKHPQDAVSAILHNGGNANMTVGDFLQHQQQTWTQKAKEANCDFSGNGTPGDQIRAAHNTIFPAVQPAATPVQYYRNWQERYPQYLEAIQNQPLGPVRNAMMEQLKQQNTTLADSANAYKGKLVADATKMVTDPSFVSMQQMPPEQQAALMENSPYTYAFAEKRADYNQRHTQNLVNADAGTMGSGFHQAADAVYAPHDTSGSINSVTDLQKLEADGKITPPAYDFLSKELAKKFTPEGQAEFSGKQQLIAYGKTQISGSPTGSFLGDPKGEQLFTRWLSLAMHTYDKGIADGKTPTQLLNRDSSDFVGQTTGMFERTLQQRQADTLAGAIRPIQGATKYTSNPAPLREPAAIWADLQAKKITPQEARAQLVRAAGEEARKGGKAYRAPLVPEGSKTAGVATGENNENELPPSAQVPRPE